MSTGEGFTVVGFSEELFQALLARVVDHVRSELSNAAEGGWLGARDAAEYLGVSRGHLHNLTSSGVLPRHGAKGQRFRFKRGDLDAYIESRGRAAA